MVIQFKLFFIKLIHSTLMLIGFMPQAGLQYTAKMWFAQENRQI